jgi:hypothetical protein
MKAKLLLVLITFILSIFITSCDNKDNFNVEAYREKLKKSQNKRVPIEQKKAIEKSIFPNIKN